jgi:hypothetical protein
MLPQLLSVIYLLFNYGLFNKTVNISGYVASNGWVFGQ